MSNTTCTKFVFTLFLGCLILTGVAAAGVKDALSRGQTLQQAIESEIRNGVTVQEATRRAMQELPKQKKTIFAAALMVAPGEAPSLVEIALANGIPAAEVTAMALRSSPEQAEEILRRGIAMDESAAVDLLKKAIQSGVEPERITPLINEFVLSSMQGETLSADERQRRMLSAQEILSSHYDELKESLLQEPLYDTPLRNGGSVRAASPN